MQVILVPLDGHDHDRIALKAAYSMASLFKAHIDGLSILPDVGEVAPSMAAETSAGAVDELAHATVKESKLQSRLAKQAFRAALLDQDVKRIDDPAERSQRDQLTVRWREVSGAPNATLAEYGASADLIIFAVDKTGMPPSRQALFEATLLSTSRPILLVPPSGLGQMAKMALAWDGRTPTIRALSGAMPILKQADEVHILATGMVGRKTRKGNKLADYLGLHGVATIRHVAEADANVGAQLVQQARELQVDLLVLGGFGRGRLHALVFGSVTQYVLDHAGIPLLLAH